MNKLCNLALVLAAGTAWAAPGDPDLSNPVLVDAQIRYIDGGQLLSILPDPFPDNSLVGHWIAVRVYVDLPIQYFRIVSNEHFDQWNISVFEVAEDLASVGGRNWWYYDEAFLFTIYAPQPEPPQVMSMSLGAGGTYALAVDEEIDHPCTIEASTDMQTWQPIAVAVPEDGMLHFTDPAAPTVRSRLYRVALP